MIHQNILFLLPHVLFPVFVSSEVSFSLLNALSRAPSYRISISELSFFSTPPSLVYVFPWSYSASTGFINECPTQLLSKFPSFKNNFSEDVEKRFFFVSHLTGITYSNFYNNSGISNLYNDRMALSTLVRFYLVFFVNIGLLIGCLVLFIWLMNHYPPISANKVWCFLFKSSVVGFYFFKKISSYLDRTYKAMKCSFQMY